MLTKFIRRLFPGPVPGGVGHLQRQIDELRGAVSTLNGALYAVAVCAGAANGQAMAMGDSQEKLLGLGKRLRDDLADLMAAHGMLVTICVASDVFPMASYRALVGLAQSRMDQQLAELRDEIRHDAAAACGTLPRIGRRLGVEAGTVLVFRFPAHCCDWNRNDSRLFTISQGSALRRDLRTMRRAVHGGSDPASVRKSGRRRVAHRIARRPERRRHRNQDIADRLNRTHGDWVRYVVADEGAGSDHDTDDYEFDDDGSRLAGSDAIGGLRFPVVLFAGIVGQFRNAQSTRSLQRSRPSQCPIQFEWK